MEKNLKECKSCKQTKLHVLEKKYDMKNKRFVDEDGKAWNGRNCAECHKSKMKIHMKAKRSFVKVEEK